MHIIDITSCVYCGQTANCWDHIFPKQEKTVPSCWLCNSIASDKTFDTFEEKAYFLLNKALQNNRARLEILSITIPLMMDALYKPKENAKSFCWNCGKIKKRHSNKYCGAICAGIAGRFQRRWRPS